MGVYILLAVKMGGNIFVTVQFPCMAMQIFNYKFCHIFLQSEKGPGLDGDGEKCGPDIDAISDFFLAV
jgi:hypothetical protein